MVLACTAWRVFRYGRSVARAEKYSDGKVGDTKITKKFWGWQGELQGT